MQHLSTSQLRQLETIGKSPSGPQLKALLDTEIEATNATLRKFTGETLLREQGKAIFLDEFVSKLFPPSRVIPRPNQDAPPMRFTNGSTY